MLRASLTSVNQGPEHHRNCAGLTVRHPWSGSTHGSGGCRTWDGKNHRHSQMADHSVPYALELQKRKRESEREKRNVLTTLLAFNIGSSFRNLLIPSSPNLHGNFQAPSASPTSPSQSSSANCSTLTPSAPVFCMDCPSCRSSSL